MIFIHQLIFFRNDWPGPVALPRLFGNLARTRGSSKGWKESQVAGCPHNVYPQTKGQNLIKPWWLLTLISQECTSHRGLSVVSLGASCPLKHTNCTHKSHWMVSLSSDCVCACVSERGNEAGPRSRRREGLANRETLLASRPKSLDTFLQLLHHGRHQSKPLEEHICIIMSWHTAKS